MAALAFHIPASGASPEKYAANSVLAQGSWVKINISAPGLQTLTRQTLRNFGFTNPDNVYVYGYGGQMIPEALSPDFPMTCLPCL